MMNRVEMNENMMEQVNGGLTDDNLEAEPNYSDNTTCGEAARETLDSLDSGWQGSWYGKAASTIYGWFN